MCWTMLPAKLGAWFMGYCKEEGRSLVRLLFDVTKIIKIVMGLALHVSLLVNH